MRRRLHEVRDEHAEAVKAREDAIVAAYEAGGGMREIADEVGFSHVGISKLLERLGVRRRDMTVDELIADEKRRGAR
jgi:DNA-binding transcriptional regulator LsrR (DeoR family)